jgi:hypothetical protein
MPSFGGAWKWLRPVTRTTAALDLCYSEPERPDQGSTAEGSINTAGIPPQPHARVNTCVSPGRNTDGSKKAAGILKRRSTDTCGGLGGSTWIPRLPACRFPPAAAAASSSVSRSKPTRCGVQSPPRQLLSRSRKCPRTPRWTKFLLRFVHLRLASLEFETPAGPKQDMPDSRCGPFWMMYQIQVIFPTT